MELVVISQTLEFGWVLIVWFLNLVDFDILVMFLTGGLAVSFGFRVWTCLFGV